MATEAGAYKPLTLADWGVVFKSAGLVILRAILLCTAVFLLAWVRGGTDPLKYALTVAVSLACLYAALGSSSFKLWAVYLVGFVAFAQLRSYGDDLGMPVQYEYPIVMERALFFGHIPSIWLQDRLYTYAHLGPLEAYTIVVYLSYFFVPHIVALAIWKWDRERLGRYVLAFLGTLYIGLIVCAILPTAPPWLASQVGDVGHVYQVIPDISNEVTPGAYGPAYEVAGVNPVAAMPSLHAGIPWLLAIVAWRYRIWRWPALVYACSMTFAIVYLGEHYAVDGLAGLAAAAVAWALAGKVIELWNARRAAPGNSASVSAPAPAPAAAAD